VSLPEQGASERVDCVVVGAGVVGLAVARELAMAGREVLVLESQRAIGTGTSSRNSEVIHAGIYYATGTLKARLCVAGRERLYQYCARNGVEHRRLGKLIVATSRDEVPTLARYAAQARANGVDELQPLDEAQVRALEPDVNCVAGLLSPASGIVDSHGLMLAYQADLEAHGGVIAFNTPIIGGAMHPDRVVVHTGGAEPYRLLARTVVNCAGLEAQQVSAAIAGVPPARIPSRYLAKGHYFAMSGRAPFTHLVYPVANAAGLGTHVTLDLAGNARFGPDVQWIDDIDYGFDESRKAEFVAAIQRYYPQLDAAQLYPAYTGIRPKIAGPGQPAADFCLRGPVEHGGPLLALYGIESPGLTASLAIAEYAAALLGTPA
jgi:L-2-hydroxyglutarate oxidase LhgO